MPHRNTLINTVHNNVITMKMFLIVITVAYERYTTKHVDREYDGLLSDYKFLIIIS